MISKSFQIVLIIITALNILINIFYIKKGEMRVKYSLIWLTLSIALLVLAIYPYTIMSFAKVLNISSDTNALFMFFIGFLYLISFSFSIMFSRNSRKITPLVQHIAIMDKQIKELNVKIDELSNNNAN